METTPEPTAENPPAENHQASKSPIRVGAYLGVAIGVACIVYGVMTFTDNKPVPYSLGFLIAGIVELFSCWYAMRGSRIAWSFAVSLTGTGAFVFLFGIPKVRDGLGVGTAIAVVPFFVLALTTAFLIATDEELR